jgi:hypothetical protein
MTNYGPGLPITTIGAFNLALEAGYLLFVKNWNKTAHPIILANMQYRIVKRFVEGGQVSHARKLNRRY